MRTFMSKLSLQTILPGNKPTFHHNNQVSESQIDHILYFIPDMYQDTKIVFADHLCQKEHPCNLSSHDVILGQITFPIEPTFEDETDY